MKKIILAIFIGLPVLVVGILLYVLTAQDIESLLTCATSDNTRDWAKPVCRYYVLNYRGTKEDIATLERGVGLAYVFGNKDYIFEDFLINKGIDINKISPVNGLTPLHSAVIENNAELTKYLLEHGASVTIQAHKQNCYQTNKHRWNSSRCYRIKIQKPIARRCDSCC